MSSSKAATETLPTATHVAPVAPVMPTRWKGEQMPLVGGFLLLLFVAATTGWLYYQNHQEAQSAARTLQIRSTAYHLLTLVQDTETGQRGYLLTGNRRYLEPYSNGLQAIPAALDEMERLAAGSGVQMRTLARLRQAINAKLAELGKTVALMDKADKAGALSIVNNDSGNNLMTDIRAEIDRLEAEEARSQTAQMDAGERNGILLASASIVGLALVVVLAGFTLVTSRRSTQALLRAQAALRHTNDNLEGLVADRVAELQMANDEIQRFAYIVSHDLRAPLVNVMGFTSELDAASDDIANFLKAVEVRAPDLVTPDRRVAIEADLPEALGFIRTSTAKMDRLINAILKLSREGRRVLTPQPIDLHALIEAQGESLSQQLSATRSELAIQPGLPDLVSDRLAVEQIFGNLIENATKYLAPHRPGRISVSGERLGPIVRYDIADNGRGIDSRDFERIFELFRRSGEQDKPGEGIGLAYVRNLARRLGGNVTVSSEFGSGSTFTVTLPAVFNPNRTVRS